MLGLGSSFQNNKDGVQECRVPGLGCSNGVAGAPGSSPPRIAVLGTVYTRLLEPLE